MNMHKGARLSPYSRALLVKRIVEHSLRVEEAAQAAGVSEWTAYKWLRRYREEGLSGLADRSSRPRACPCRSYRAPAYPTNLSGDRPGFGHGAKCGETLAATGRTQSTGCVGTGDVIRRYEHDAPGDLLRLDIKKLGRFWRPGHRITGDRKIDSQGAGWEYVHVAIDDHSRVALSSIEPDEKAGSANRAFSRPCVITVILASALPVS